ncbi:unnamed protein product, partial [Mesorhabditis belari]|uniref:Uncharacterized protein n=1 Tax=Mesorhabditis belari TaxID=2138241 RepID=A0AAF3F6H0_9BILA
MIISRQYCDNLLITAPASTFGWFMGFMAKEGKARVFYSEPYAKSSGDLVQEFRPRFIQISLTRDLRQRD